MKFKMGVILFILTFMFSFSAIAQDSDENNEPVNQNPVNQPDETNDNQDVPPAQDSDENNQPVNQPDETNNNPNVPPAQDSDENNQPVNQNPVNQNPVNQPDETNDNQNVPPVSVQNSAENNEPVKQTPVNQPDETNINENITKSTEKTHLIGDEIVVTPAGREEKVFDSPRAVGIVNSVDMEERGVISAPDSLLEENGVYMQKTGTHAGAPIIRGLIGQQVLHLFDGIRLNNAATRSGPNETFHLIDPFTINQIEILRGPGSILYGSDALGGVINILSFQPIVNSDLFYDIGADVFGVYSSANNGLVGRPSLRGQFGPVGFLGGFTASYIQDLRGGWETGNQEFTSYDELNGNIGLVFRLDEHNYLYTNYYSYRLYNGYRNEKSWPITANEIRKYEESFHDLGYLRYRYIDSGVFSLGEFTVGYRRWHQLIDRYRLNKDRTETMDDTLQGLFAIARGVVDLGNWSILSFGAEYYWDYINSSQTRQKISSTEFTFEDDVLGDGDPGNDFRGTYVDGSQYHDMGIYLYDTINPFSNFNIDVGGRFSYTLVNIPEEPLALDNTSFSLDEIDTSFYSFVFGGDINYTARPFKFIVGVNQGYRAPNIDDYSHIGSEGARFDVQNPDLDESEKSLTLESGIKVENEYIYGEIFGYYTWLNDLIIPEPTGETIDGQVATRRTNVSSGSIWGLEASLRIFLTQQWSLIGQVSYTYGEADCPSLGDDAEEEVCEGRVDEDGDGIAEKPGVSPYRRVPPLNGLVGLRYESITQRWFAEVILRWALKQDRLSPDDIRDTTRIPEGGTPGYAVVSLRGGYKINDWLRFTLNLENLTNESYRIHGSGVDSSGINFIGLLHFTY